MVDDKKSCGGGGPKVLRPRLHLGRDKQHGEGEFEPVSPTNPNPMMAHHFGFYDLNTIELPRRFFSPGVLPSLGDILETQAISELLICPEVKK